MMTLAQALERLKNSPLRSVQQNDQKERINLETFFQIGKNLTESFNNPLAQEETSCPS